MPHATQRWIGIGLAGAGLAGIGVGAAFGAVALAKLSESNDGPCNSENRCTAGGLALRRESSDAATGSTIGFAVGAAALAAGVVVYLTAPRDGEAITLAPAVGTGGAGAVVAGRF